MVSTTTAIIILGAITLVGLTCFYYYEKILVPKMNISPPADKILKLVGESGDFEIMPYNCGSDYDYLIKDVVTGKETLIGSHCFYETYYSVVGDLEWMNKYEKEALYKTVDKIMEKKKEDIQKVEKELEIVRKNNLREEAKKVYQDR